MPVHHRAELPVVEDALCKTGRRPRRLGNIIGAADGEKVSSVEVTVTVLRFLVERVVENLSPVLADFVQRVRPGVSKLCAEPAPCSGPENSLQCIVIGSSSGVELEDIAEVGEIAILIYVADDIQLAAF